MRGRALMLTSALWLAGCETSPAEPSREEDRCEVPVTGVAVTFCGQDFAIGDAAAFGLTELASAPVPPRVTARVGDHVVQLDGARLVVRAAESLAKTGDVYLGWFARSLDVVSARRVVVQTDLGATFVDLDAAGVPSVSAVWRGATVLGAEAGRVAILSPGGFALLDVADPLSPLEVACAQGPAGVFGYDFPLRMQDGHLLVVAPTGGDAWRAWIYDVGTTPIGPPLEIPGDAPTAVLHRDRLLVFPNAREDLAVLYRIGDGALEELARVAAPRVEPYSGNVVVGGLLALAGRYESPTRLIDLESDRAEVYRLVEARACGWVVAPVAGGESLGLRPAGDPSMRLAPDAVGEDCPLPTSFAERVDIAAREPGGARALVRGDTWRFLDLTTFESTPTPLSDDLGATPHWVGEHLYMVRQTGSDWGMAVRGTIDVYDARDLGVPPHRVPRDHTLFGVAAGERLWLLSDPGVSVYAEPGPVSERHIWSLGVDGTTLIEHPELDDLRPIAVAAQGGTLWVLDQRGFVRRSRGGVLEDSPRFALGESSGVVLMASELGLFIADPTHALGWWVDQELTPRRFSAPADCLVRQLAAADDTRVYVLAQRYDPNGARLTSELLIGEPVALGRTFELALVAREPGAPWVYPGTPTLLIEGTQQRAVRIP